MEEILSLKRYGHDIRIFSKWCDLSNMNDKVLEHDLLGCVIYDEEGKLLIRQYFDRVKGFLWKWLSSRQYRKSFAHDFFPARRLKSEVQAVLRQQLAGLGWRAALALRAEIFQKIWLEAMKLNNLSLARQQVVIRSQKFHPEHMHCPFLFFVDTRKLKQLIKEFPDVPYTVTLRSRDVYLNSTNQRYVQLRDRLIRRATQVFTISNYNKRELSVRLDLRGEMQVIHSSIDTDLFTADLTVEKKPNQLLSIARLVPKKGLELLIDACAIMHAAGQDFHLSIVGEGVLKLPLLEKIKQLGLHEKVEIIGPFRQRKIKELLDMAEVFVLPCVVAPDGDRDMLPNSVKEAMAMNLVVVTSDISGIEELVKDGINGLLAQPNDAQDLAEKMMRAMSDKEFAKQAGVAARARILEEFSIASEGSKFNSALLRINASRHKGLASSGQAAQA
ncbi:glycosyltransferase [Rugamonas sp. FT82W]|uniref:Glycosyltransferase n=1 Tax=Duganella vulcania TaxID=2692166 RepID=A0A845FZZ0_9BURK|nr:glycosyltransferase [Duganella vulcania]MYM86186.1 glycosyltransferase [Duganella vulcania]